jgi:hypothetical protein
VRSSRRTVGAAQFTQRLQTTAQDNTQARYYTLNRHDACMSRLQDAMFSALFVDYGAHAAKRKFLS